MTYEQSREHCLLQHIQWREDNPDRKVDEPQLANQLGMDLVEFLARIEALKKSRLSIFPPNSDLSDIGNGK
jgi:hypothetical protein